MSRRVATLGDMKKKREEEEKEKSQDYFTGGASSGMMVQDPQQQQQQQQQQGGRSAGDLVRGLFQQAREHGAENYEEMQKDQERAKKEKQFDGAGYRLGTERTADLPPVPVTGTTGPRSQGPVTRTLTFYSNGFTVDDGDLRRFDAPENQEFLADINAGVAPRELMQGSTPVSVNLVDKKDTEWTSKMKKRVPFQGGGQKLGKSSSGTSPSRAAGSSAKPGLPPPPGSASGAPAPSMTVDESQPTTTLQIRLHDGTRMVAKFNLSHTIGDLRLFIMSARPLPAGQLFDIILPFPKRTILSDDSQTLEAAGLKNASVVQAFK